MFYGNGAAMGWNQRMVDETGLWEFTEAVRGYNAMQDGEPDLPAPSAEEHDELYARFVTKTIA